MVSIDVIEKMALQVSDHITLKEIFQEKKGKKPLKKTEDPVSPCEIKQVLDRLKVNEFQPKALENDEMSA